MRFGISTPVVRERTHALVRNSVRIAVMLAGVLMPFTNLSADPTETAAVDCAIRTTSAGGTVRLEALAKARQAAAGSYRLLVAKSGAGGSTRNVQSGAFNVQANETRVLSMSSISLGPQDRYEAELTIEWNGQAQKCRAASDERVERPDRRTL